MRYITETDPRLIFNRIEYKHRDEKTEMDVEVWKLKQFNELWFIRLIANRIKEEKSVEDFASLIKLHNLIVDLGYDRLWSQMTIIINNLIESVGRRFFYETVKSIEPDFEMPSRKDMIILEEITKEKRRLRKEYRHESSHAFFLEIIPPRCG